MSREDEREKFHRLFAECKQLVEDHKKYKRSESRFIREFTETISRVAYEHFTGDPPHPDIHMLTDTSPEVIRKRLTNDKIYSTDLLCAFGMFHRCMEVFMDDDNPAEWQYLRKRVKFRYYTEEVIEEDVQKVVGHAPEKFTAEDIAFLRERIREEGRIEDFYTEFKKKIHGTMKKKVVESFPEIMEITGNGLREIDSISYTYAIDIYYRFMEVLDQ